VNLKGEKIKGIYGGDNIDKLKYDLRHKGFYIFYIKRKNRFKRFLINNRLSNKDLYIFCDELSILLESGVNLPQSIGLLGEYFKNTMVKNSLVSINQGLFSGETLYSSINRYRFIYPTFLIEMIRIGEDSGELPKILKKLSYYYRGEEDINSELMKALSYPIMVFFVALSVIIFLVFNILPNFIQLLVSFESEIPKYSKIIFSVVNYLNNNIYFISLILISLTLFLLYYFKTHRGSQRFYSIIINTPYIGKIYKKVQISRLFMTIGIMYSSGMNILDSLEKSTAVIKNTIILGKVNEIKNSILKGNSLSKSFNDSSLFSHSVIAMIAIGEERGNLQDIFIKISERYEKEVLQSINTWIKYIEPMIIIIISILVGIILVAILIPMLSIMDSIAL
jgi:type IV pilus assembly protein PilC